MIFKNFQSIKLSTLGMGNMRLPGNKNPEPGHTLDWDESQKIIDYAMANGINYYDTAHVYNNGESEACLGKCLKKYPRDSFYIATKFNIGAEKDYKKVFKEQLERLQTDHIDFYLIHCLLDNNMQEYIESGAIEYFLEQKKLGKISYLGFSAHSSSETLEKFSDYHKWDFAQLQINYYDWIYGATKKDYEILASRNIPIIVMEPVRGGRLANLTEECNNRLKTAHPEWSVASWALRFAKKLPGVQVVLSGMSNMEQIVDNCKTFCDETQMTEADEKLILEVCKDFKKQLQVPCTACRYCCDGCPKKINIPEYLNVYNDYKVNGGWGLKGKVEKVQSEGKPSDCIACGACTKHCPQSIDIPSALKDLAAALG